MKETKKKVVEKELSVESSKPKNEMIETSLDELTKGIYSFGDLVGRIVYGFNTKSEENNPPGPYRSIGDLIEDLPRELQRLNKILCEHMKELAKALL